MEIGYSIADPATGAWIEEGIINSGAIAVGLTDPTVAYDRATGDFLVCAMPLDRASIAVARFDAGSGQFGSWQTVGTGMGLDKPWIVAGAAIQPTGNAPAMPSEFYITWHGTADGNKLHYRRSRDGGFTWVGGLALTNLNDSNSTINGVLAMPRVYETWPLYVGYRSVNGPGVIRFLRGDDINSGPHAGKVQFTVLVDSGGQPVELPTDLVSTSLFTVAAGPNFVSGVSNPLSAPGFDLSVDPTHSGRLYLVYQELDSPSGSDVSVYVRKLIRQSGNIWQLQAPTTISDNAINNSDDQFMPTMDVDAGGRIHVIYYDDQQFRPPQTDSTEYDAKFNLWYAYSADQAQTWSYWNLCDNPTGDCVESESAVDYSVIDYEVFSPLALRDYIGIDVGPDGDVWTTFMGISNDRDPDPEADKTLIWSTRIPW